jgi:hypothetical protein
MSKVQSREEIASRLAALTQNQSSSADARLLAEAALWIMSELGNVRTVSNSALSTAQSAETKVARR